MLSKLNTTCLSRHVQWTCCLIRSSTSFTVNQPSEVKFDSVSDAYGYKSKGELFRGWLVFKLCSYTPLVNRLNQVEKLFLALSQKMTLVCLSPSSRFSMVYAVWSVDERSKVLYDRPSTGISSLEQTKRKWNRSSNVYVNMVWRSSSIIQWNQISLARRRRSGFHRYTTINSCFWCDLGRTILRWCWRGRMKIFTMKTCWNRFVMFRPLLNSLEHQRSLQWKSLPSFTRIFSKS